MKVAVALIVSEHVSGSGSEIFDCSERDRDETPALEAAMREARESFPGADEDPRQELTFVISLKEPVFSPIRLEVYQGAIRLVSATQ